MEEAKTHYSLRYGRAASGVNDAAAWLCRHGRRDLAAPRERMAIYTIQRSFFGDVQVSVPLSLRGA
jgi:hypothetical protein